MIGPGNAGEWLMRVVAVQHPNVILAQQGVICRDTQAHNITGYLTCCVRAATFNPVFLNDGGSSNKNENSDIMSSASGKVGLSSIRAWG